MKIGLIADTHGLLRPEVFQALSGVDLILHAGDVGSSEILIELGAIAPVEAVWGNIDSVSLRSQLPERSTIEIGGRTVTLLHGHQFGAPTAAALAGAYPRSQLVVFGHSHRPEIERVGETLAVNPGSAGPRRFDLPVTVAIAEWMDQEITATLIELQTG